MLDSQTHSRGSQQKYKMGTRSGHPIKFLEPEWTPVDWTDISFALPRVYRYNGHQDTTLADHLALCTILSTVRHGPGRITALCAAHDIHEVYVGDVAGPMKEFIPDFRFIEDMWHKHVHEELGLGELSPEEKAIVKEIDILALHCECRYHDFNRMWIQEDFSEVEVSTDDMTWTNVVFGMNNETKLNLIRNAIQYGVQDG